MNKPPSFVYFSANCAQYEPQRKKRAFGHVRQTKIITKTCLFKYNELSPKKKKKNENFQIKNSDIFHTFAQNKDCWYSLEQTRRGGSNEYPQSMFWANIRK